MAWYESWKPYLIVSVIGSVSAVAYIVYKDASLLSIIMGAVTTFVLFPIVMMSTYMWLTGKGSRFINGIDWTKLSEEETKNTVSHVGFWLMISMIIMMYGMSVIVSHIWIGLAVLGIAIVLAIVLIARMMSGNLKKPMMDVDSIKAFSVFLIVAAVSLVPTTVLMTEYTLSESVDVTVGDTSFTVKAPMFDHTFSYEEIDEIQYIEDFNKGTRKWGYNTGTICSGKYQNDMFGDYQLAAYKNVRPCIAISMIGEMYAFNQDSDSATMDLYDQLKSKIP